MIISLVRVNNLILASIIAVHDPLIGSWHLTLILDDDVTIITGVYSQVLNFESSARSGVIFSYIIDLM